jgi:hypothetical protein
MGVRQKTRSVRAVWAPSLARRVMRHRGVQASAMIVAGLIVSFALSAKVAALDQARLAWESTTTVAVVTKPVEIGQPVAGAVELRDLPVAMVPVEAASEVEPGSLAKVPLHVGEIVLTPRLTNSEADSPGAGTVALTLAVATQVPFLDVGDLVDLWVVDSVNFSSRRVAEHVVVLAFSDHDVTVAVPEGQVGDVAAVSLRPVTLTLVG